MLMYFSTSFFFFFNDTATTEIYTLSLHDALPISFLRHLHGLGIDVQRIEGIGHIRSEEHTSELQSPCNLVCRLLLEKKKQQPHQRVGVSEARPGAARHLVEARQVASHPAAASQQS